MIILSMAYVSKEQITDITVWQFCPMWQDNNKEIRCRWPQQEGPVGDCVISCTDVQWEWWEGGMNINTGGGVVLISQTQHSIWSKGPTRIFTYLFPPEMLPDLLSYSSTLSLSIVPLVQTDNLSTQGLHIVTTGYMGSGSRTKWFVLVPTKL